MVRSRALGTLLCAFLLIVPAACDDPTSVGGELIGQQGVGPERVELELNVSTVQVAPITGATSSTVLSASRFLAGQTTDDPLGDVEATAYIDFARASAPSNLADRTLEAVELHLEPDYFYGDTTQTPTYALYGMREEWEASNARADTMGIAETVDPQRITTFSVQPSDTLTTVTLPPSWVRAHADVLTIEDDSTFAEAFHGFQIRPLGGSSVAGFRPASGSNTMLRAVFETQDDEETPEALHNVARQLTTVRQPDPKPVEDRYVIQDGTGRALSFTFNLPDSLENASLNSATLVLEVDSTLENTESRFVRPEIETLNLYDASGTDPRPIQISSGVLAGLNRLDAPPRFENNFAVIDLVQDLLLDDAGAETGAGRYQLRPALRGVQTPFGAIVQVSVPSLNSTLIRSDEGHRPRLVLTYTSTDE